MISRLFYTAELRFLTNRQSLLPIGDVDAQLALNYTPLLNVLAINPLQQELDIYASIVLIKNTVF
jgi:hypothetical protein